MYISTCSCCNATYYGESECLFFVRASEHLGMSPLTGKQVKNSKKLAIFDHICWRVILLKENNKFKLYLKESLLIKSDKPIEIFVATL